MNVSIPSKRDFCLLHGQSFMTDHNYNPIWKVSIPSKRDFCLLPQKELFGQVVTITSSFNPVQAGFLFITFLSRRLINSRLYCFNPVQAGFLFITMEDEDNDGVNPPAAINKWFQSRPSGIFVYYGAKKISGSLAIPRPHTTFQSRPSGIFVYYAILMTDTAWHLKVSIPSKRDFCLLRLCH
jgi:hypothetical protein